MKAEDFYLQSGYDESDMLARVFTGKEMIRFAETFAKLSGAKHYLKGRTDKPPKENELLCLCKASAYTDSESNIFTILLYTDPHYYDVFERCRIDYSNVIKWWDLRNFES